MHSLILLLGGNKGNTEKIFRSALTKLSECVGTVQQSSSLYSSESWGFFADSAFLNQVLMVYTHLSADEALQECLRIETELGRERTCSLEYESRSIDIDILFYDSEVVDKPHLTIPHPHIQHRRFTLEPLVELIPNFVHPVLNQTTTELLQNCTDSLWVHKVAPKTF
ncbi:MAG: 2-amino-4-hydroxy-6-hydroxymethyldihydropteridine diphosphokinase [Bacteroidales bacterium]